ncbi:hypothetical protein [Microbacterium sp. che218]|uniref:hypothetical protein n=1 Tax=Microbacterium sp. che218 TaxID=3140649 RepID=UPI00336805C4
MSTTPPPPGPYDAPAPRNDGYAAPSAPAAHNAPAAPAYVPPADNRPVLSNRLGLIAFVVSLVAVVGGSIIAFIAGLQSAGVAQYAQQNGSSAGQIDPATVPPGVEQSALAFAVLSVVAFVVYGVFGLWGFIQGIVAAIKRRGRGYGIAAIIIAVLGGIVVIVALGVGTSAGLGSA